MDEYGISLGQLFFVGLVSVLAVTVAVVGLETLYYWQLEQVAAAEMAEEPASKAAPLLAAQQKRLTEYALVDGKKGIVAIPIDRAMPLVLKELSRQGAAASPRGGVTK